MPVERVRHAGRPGDQFIPITIHVPASVINEIDRLVDEGRYFSRSEATRHALRQFITIERGLLVPALGVNLTEGLEDWEA